MQNNDHHHNGEDVSKVNEGPEKRKQNHGKSKKTVFSKILDFDNISIKPSFLGISIDISKIIEKRKK